MDSKITDYLINQLDCYINYPEIYDDDDREAFVAQFLIKGRRYDDFTESYYRTWEPTENYKDELRRWAKEELQSNIIDEELLDAVIDDLFQIDGVVARLMDEITDVARASDGDSDSASDNGDGDGDGDSDDPVPSPKIDASAPA